MNRPTAFASTMRIRDLLRLPRDQPAPDRVALRPEVLALVVEALAVLLTTMPSDTQSSRVTMPPSNFGARASTATAWHARAIADRLRAGVEHQPAAACPVLYGVPRMMKLSAASPQTSRSHSRFDSKPPAASTRRRARTVVRAVRRSAPAPTRNAPSREVEADDLGVVHARRCRAAPRRRSSCSSAPCRRRERTRWCGRGAACRAATAGTGRRSRRIHSGHVGRPRGRPAAPAPRRSRCRVTRSRSARNSSSGYASVSIVGRRVVHAPQVARVAAVAAAKLARRASSTTTLAPASRAVSAAHSAGVAAADHRRRRSQPCRGHDDAASGSQRRSSVRPSEHDARPGPAASRRSAASRTPRDRLR